MGAQHNNRTCSADILQTSLVTDHSDQARIIESFWKAFQAEVFCHNLPIVHQKVAPDGALRFLAGLLRADIFCSMGTIAVVVYVVTFCCSLLAWLVLLAGTGAHCGARTYGDLSRSECQGTRLLSVCLPANISHATCWPHANLPVR